MEHRSDATFATTHWSVVLASGDPSSPSAQAALERLCRTYWEPIYCYIRRRGFREKEAEDLTQGFLAHILEKSRLETVERSKGKFRSLIIVSLKHYLSDTREKECAAKRGGGMEMISLEQATPDQFCEEGNPGLSETERIFDREWALALISKARKRLREECTLAKQEQLFDLLKDAIFMETSTHPEGQGLNSYAELAARSGVAQGTVKSRVSRLRRRFGELLRNEVAKTMGNSSHSDVEQEIRYLISAVSR